METTLSQSLNLYKPHKVRLEACSLCQLDCVLCSIHKRDTIIKNGYLSFDNFKKFVDTNDFVDSIELSNNGEIFLNPDLKKIIEYAYNKGIKLSAYNGVNLNNVKEDVLEALVKYKFEKITVSIDGASQETYSQYRIKGNFDTVINNIKKINYYKKLYNSEFPKLKYQFIIFGHNEHEIPEAKKLAESLGMEINYKLSWSNTWSPIKDMMFVEKECPNIHKKNKMMNYNFCVKMWTQPQINWDGQLLGCCTNTSIDFGVNVFDTGLENALKSVMYSDAQNVLLGKNFDKLPENCCTKCQNLTNMKTTGKFVDEKDIINNFFN